MVEIVRRMVNKKVLADIRDICCKLCSKNVLIGIRCSVCFWWFHCKCVGANPYLINDDDVWCCGTCALSQSENDFLLGDKDEIIEILRTKIGNLETENCELRSELLTNSSFTSCARSSKVQDLDANISFSVLETREDEFSFISDKSSIKHRRGFVGFPSHFLLESKEKLKFYYKFRFAGDQDSLKLQGNKGHCSISSNASVCMSNISERVFSNNDLLSHSLMPYEAVFFTIGDDNCYLFENYEDDNGDDIEDPLKIGLEVFKDNVKHVLVNDLSCEQEDQRDFDHEVEETPFTSCVFLKEASKNEYLDEENENSQLGSPVIKENVHTSCIMPAKSDLLQLKLQSIDSENKLSGSRCLNKNGKYACSYCNKGFKRNVDLSKHMKFGICRKNHSCDICGQSFTAFGLLKSHLMTHINDKPHSCTICKKSFFSSLSLEYHLLTHRNEISVSCNTCRQSFTNSEILKHHSCTQLEKTSYSCHICKVSFTNSDELKQHLHGHKYNRPYSCDICKKSFLTPRNLKRHLLIHSNKRPYSCNFCDKSFYYSHHLKEHTRIHTNERPYSCDICHNSFTQAGVLKKHIRTHSKEKPYFCYVCQKSFSQSKSLKCHLYYHKKDTCKTNCSCSICKNHSQV